MQSRFSVVLLLLLLPLFLFMAPEEEHHASGSLDFIGKVVNFIVLFGGLAFLLYKPAKKFLGNHSLTIDGSITGAKDSRAEAERKLKDGQKRLAELSHEISRMKEDAAEAGSKEKDRLIKKAKDDTEKMKQSTRLEIEMLSKAGIRELKEYTLTLAAAQAVNRIQRKLTAQDQADLIDKSIDRLENLYE
ncbi:MAG: ATP synthase F0 subunit B [Candidatus Aminicenantes bacterium]|nr:ATP synthase F0 subunit B [Candidatus Aminicenantes bacterium]